MLKILKFEDINPDQRAELLQRYTPEEESDVTRIVEDILENVKTRGEEAVIEYTAKFDKVELKSILATEEEFAGAADRLTAEERQAFEQAAANIRSFHELQKENMVNKEREVDGSLLGFRYLPIEGAAVYAPGGTALYPSSVLMGLIPAKIAGIEDPLLINPPGPDGQVPAAILYCAKLAGTKRLLKAGGAQGIAAAAFGLAGNPARLIVGPGNRFVTGAKSILSGRGVIRMDMPAGPSEVLVIADETANPEFVAADMLSQAEHGSDSGAVLVTDNAELAQKTAEAVERGIKERPLRADMKSAAIRDHSYILLVKNMEDAFEFSNDYAPEHLEICTKDPMKDMEKITNAGSIFLGNYAPVALGDYYSGTNHVLPTNSAAKFYSGLGVEAFMKRISYQYPTKESLKRANGPIQVMSKLEGFDQEHGNSVDVRFR